MCCAKGIFAKGILGCTGLALLQEEKGSETPHCDGEKGLRLPRSSCSDIGSEGVPTTRGSLRPFFPPQKGKPRTSQNPLSVAKTFARYRGHLGLSGRKLQIEFENGFPGPFGPRAQKVQNGVEKESKSTLFQLF